MPTDTTLTDAVHDRLTVSTLAQTAVALVLLWVLLDPSPAQFATTLASVAALGLTDALAEAYDLPDAVRRAGLGAATVAGGVGLWAVGDPRTVALPVVFLLAGAWLLADGVQTLRHRGATREPRDGHAVYRSHVRGRVTAALETRPRTRRELVADLEIDDTTVATAVDTLLDRGVIERVGSELRPATTERGRLARLRRRAVAAGRRLARPVTLELGDGEKAGDDTDDGRDASGGDPDRERRRERDRERERL